MTRSAVVVGNPKPRSRTLDAAVRLASALTGGPPDVVVDLAQLGPGLLGWGDPEVASAVERVAACDVVVVASPTYKATYTGLLKLFLDQYPGSTGLQDVVAVPLMLGGGPAHALAVEHTLRPVLSELGACLPTPGLYLVDRTAAEDPLVDHFVARWGPFVAAATGAARSSRDARAAASDTAPTEETS